MAQISLLIPSSSYCKQLCSLTVPLYTIHISVNGQAGLPFSISPSHSLDVWGGTIWQAAVCHAGELAVGKCATGQASVTPLTGLAQVSVKTDGRGRYRNGRQGGRDQESRAERANLCHHPRQAETLALRTRF
ncbi:hypothetical protein SRHO_G00151900 [Serrasalmus rhombeus]